jgi:hypothetical protein
MRTRAWIVIVIVASALLLACSNAPTSGFTQPGDDASAGAGGSSGGSNNSGGSGGSSNYGPSGGGGSSSSGGSADGSGVGSGSGGSTGSSVGSSGGRSDAGAKGINWGTLIPASELGPKVTLTAAPFTVPAGAEVYKCQVFANPFGGTNTDIVQMHGTMSAGSHHFFLFNVTAIEVAAEPPVGAIGDCAGQGLEFHPFPFLSQAPDWSVDYPAAADGSPMGYPLVGTNYLMINVHYLNTSAEAITPTVTIDITPAKPGVVKTHVGTIFLNQTTMSVPANATAANLSHSTMTWFGDATLASSYSIFTSWSHMHRWSAAFTATTNGKAFYTETNWDSPNLFIHAPNMTEPPTATGNLTAVPMTNGQAITWDCASFNDTGLPLTFGDSARSNVMCIYLGQYYPASATAPDIIDIAN